MSNRTIGRAVTRAPNSHTITPPGRLSGVGGYLGCYDLTFEIVLIALVVVWLANIAYVVWWLW